MVIVGASSPSSARWCGDSAPGRTTFVLSDFGLVGVFNREDILGGVRASRAALVRGYLKWYPHPRRMPANQSSAGLSQLDADDLADRRARWTRRGPVSSMISNCASRRRMASV